MTRSAHARVNWGRWVADCPDSACFAAEAVMPGMARAHCAECDRPYEVRWPTERAEIDRVLSLRPVPATRNWFPGETVAQLVAENMEHKVGVA